MRKAEREIKDFKEVAEVVARCQVVRLGLFAEDYPYIVPLSFGYEAENGKLTVYRLFRNILPMLFILYAGV